MGKAFTENEIEFIRRKLIESCKFCWDKYGFRKTNVNEIAKMAGISTGAFYTFFPSKEILFITTADFYSKKIVEDVTSSIPKEPTKYDLANALKNVLKELNKNHWLLSLRDDYELFIRKLSPDFFENNLKMDFINLQSIIDKFGLIPKVRTEEIVAIINTLASSLYYPEIIGEYHEEAMNLLIDGVIEKIF